MQVCIVVFLCLDFVGYVIALLSLVPLFNWVDPANFAFIFHMLFQSVVSICLRLMARHLPWIVYDCPRFLRLPTIAATQLHHM